MCQCNCNNPYISDKYTSTQYNRLYWISVNSEKKKVVQFVQAHVCVCVFAIENKDKNIQLNRNCGGGAAGVWTENHNKTMSWILLFCRHHCGECFGLLILGVDGLKKQTVGEGLICCVWSFIKCNDMKSHPTIS